MPSRIIRDGIIESEAINKLSWGAEVFYRRLMSIADDYGRYDGRVALLRTRLFGLKLDQVSDADVRKWVGECLAVAAVSVYEVEHKPYIALTKFGQQIRSKSKFPPPPGTVDPTPPDPNQARKKVMRASANRHRKPPDAQQMRADAHLGVGAAPNGAGAYAQPPSGAAAGEAQPDKSNPPPVDVFKILDEDRRRKAEYAKKNGVVLAESGSVRAEDLMGKKKAVKS